jgi:5'-methylthioadenosine phosphorylase
MPGLQDTQELILGTPFGEPSSPIVVGTLEGVQVAFLARHGIGHHLSPTEVNYRANIYALKSLGIERVLSITATGSLREDFEPGDIVIPDQLLDFTKDRKRTFFEGGLVAHVSVADPFCKDWSKSVYQAVAATEATVRKGGSMITIEGPRFSTRIESNTFRSWGIALIGMTAAPEAFLAREAELCYAALAHVTDYDVWHKSEEPVTAEMVFKILEGNTQIAEQSILNLVRNLPDERACDCENSLAAALSTQRTAVNPAALERLGLLVDKYFGN